MHHTIIVLALILLVLAVAGVAGAFSVMDYATNQANRIITGIETATGWDCLYRIIDNDDLFAVGVYCDK